jgi:dihydroorotase
MIGLEFAYTVAQQVLIDSGASNLERLAEVMSTAPARISGLDGQGNYLLPGSPANLTLVNLGQAWVGVAKTHSKSSNNPYQGLEFKGRVVHTIFDGEFTLKDQTIRGANIDV